MLSAISFGVFCRSAPSTSAIIRSRKVEPGAAVMRTLIQSDSTCVPPVTAERSPPRFADHRSGFARDGGLVDRGDAFDHLAVGGNDVAGLDEHDVADLQLGARHRSCSSVRPSPPSSLAWVSVRVRRSDFGLRLAAAFGDRLGEVREQHA